MGLLPKDVSAWVSRIGRTIYTRLQAAAAIGQIHLTGAYQQRFQTTGIDTALVLLTHDDLSDRNRYLNARATLETLIRFGVVTVINENDSVATDEIRFGDNDTLAARVCSLVGADVLVVLTDQSGLHESDPRLQPDARLIGEASAANPELESMAGASTGSHRSRRHENETTGGCPRGTGRLPHRNRRWPTPERIGFYIFR